MKRGRWKCRPSLRLRLWLGALGLAILTLGGAGLAIFGLTATEQRAHQALAAQTRLEAWSSLSTQLNEWMLKRMIEGREASSSPVEAAITRLEILTHEDVAAAPNPLDASLRAADIRHVARIKSFFRQLSALAPDTPSGQAGIAFQLTHAPPIIAARIEHETRRRDMALTDLDTLRRPLRLTMIGLAVAAPLLLLVVWRATLRPLFQGLHRLSVEAGALSAEGRFSAFTRHDELGLMVARIRQATTRLARKRIQLERDLSNLELLVADRTHELRDANARLSAIDANRRRFFADVSHELRTPLTVIMGEAELGLMCTDPDIRESFQTIGARAERLFRRIEDLLRIARSESGELELLLRPVALRSIIQAAQGDVAPLLDRGGVSVAIDIDPKTTVIADADWLRQMFAGFFENSEKFAGKGSTILIAAQSGPKVSRITICDDGANPPPQDAVLFERHQRSAPQGVSGFGIGLALAHWAARAFGGDLKRLRLQKGFGLELELLNDLGTRHG